MTVHSHWGWSSILDGLGKVHYVHFVMMRTACTAYDAAWSAQVYFYMINLHFDGVSKYSSLSHYPTSSS